MSFVELYCKLVSTPITNSQFISWANRMQNFFYINVLDVDAKDVVFQEGPLTVEAICTTGAVELEVTLEDEEEDLFVFGATRDYAIQDQYPPLGTNKYHVLSKGSEFKATMWKKPLPGGKKATFDSENDYDFGAVVVMAPNTGKTYYVGWDGDEMVGVTGEDTEPPSHLEVGGHCAIAGPFHVSFPKK
jgi:hypothetical protein